MAKVRIGASSFAFGLAILAGACSALTGVDKYDVNDCPRGDCSEAGASSSSGDAARDGAASDGTSLVDTAVDTFACPVGTSLVTLTVTGNVETVTAEPGGVLVPPNPGSLCIPVGQVRLRANNNPKGTWTCTAGCVGSAQDTDTFNFQNPAAGSTITANLQN